MQRVSKSEPFPNRTWKDVLAPNVQYVIDTESRIVVVQFQKKLTLLDIQTYVQSVVAHSSFDPTFSEIVDLTKVEEVDLQATEFLNLADKVDPFSVEAKRAFVVRTSVQNHAARMHKILGTDRKIEIFRSVAEAEQWIRRSP